MSRVLASATVLATGILLATAFISAGHAGHPMMDDPILLAATGATGSNSLTTSTDNNAVQDQAQQTEPRENRKKKRNE